MNVISSTQTKLVPRDEIPVLGHMSRNRSISKGLHSNPVCRQTRVLEGGYK